MDERLSARLARAGLLLGVLAIVALSVFPGPSGLPLQTSDKLQHLLAYALVAICVPLGFARRSTRCSWVLGLFALGCALEIAQAFLPGRHAAMLDVLANGMGIAVGMGLGWMCVAVNSARDHESAASQCSPSIRYRRSLSGQRAPPC